MQMAVIVAALYLLVGALRLGFLTNLLSHAVISGFITGAAITIGLSQVRDAWSARGVETRTSCVVGFEDGDADPLPRHSPNCQCTLVILVLLTASE